MGDLGPLKTQPLNIGFDGINVFITFFKWVGVIKPQVGFAKLLSDAKIQTNTFGVSNADNRWVLAESV